ncbi:MAG: lasso peptide biosynthesis protein [Armatimonadetes bacterium]|nr:lasso peptide biosynthesis protein [Armatimonadota bacterium]
MRRYIRLFPALMLILLGVRAGAYTVPYECWMGAYIGDKKVGYLSFKIDKSELDGVKGYRISSVLNNRLTVLGADLTQLVTTVVYTDSKYAPLKEDFSMSSGGKTTAIRAVFGKDKVECAISPGSGSSTQTIPIPDGVSLVGDALFATPDSQPEIGKEYNLHYFNPLTLSIDRLTIKAEGKERVKLGDTEFDTIVLRNITPMGEMTVWQEANGDVVKLKAMMGITMVRQDKATAMAGIEAGTQQDFAVQTSVKPDKDIPHPRDLKELEIIFTGMGDGSMMINDARQSAASDNGHSDRVRYRIKPVEFDADKSLQRPINDEKYSEFLASALYLNCDDKSMQDRVRKIVGDEKNAFRACAEIRQWINGYMKADPSIGITRSASDVLKSRKGVCRDYGILFAALARAAGIPAKIAAGVLYTNGAFYYHVWVECFVGEWVPFDATLPTDYVDATHIKMAEGDATSMFGLSKVIGSLKAEVVSYK